MKDLFVFAADSECQAVMQSVLGRHHSLGIRPITFDVDRHFGRDCGMVKDGPELVGLKVRKNAYSRVVLVCDHQGSGYPGTAPALAADLLERLHHVTWRDRSQVTIIEPELEEWLWHNHSSVAKALSISVAELAVYVIGARLPEDMGPKELLQRVVYETLKRKALLIDEFAAIGRTASLKDWQKSCSFAGFVATLQEWFPAE